ncbi:MAG: N,N-dimethylformamidase beta subunit family domain-containing protein [Candidatus Eiseniibacteriota bacterium]
MLQERTIRFECSGKRPGLSRTLPGALRGPWALRFALLGPALALLLSARPGFPVTEKGSTAGPVAAENARQGSKDWELSKPATNREIEGYASKVSVRPKETVELHVSTASKTFDIDIYRLGWYGGLGARKISGTSGVAGGLRATPGPRQGDGLVECRWPVSYTVQVGSDWVSGVYLAKLTASASGRQTFVPFVVLEKPGIPHPAAFLFQCAVTTWQAYNAWGGKSLYDFNSKGEARARRVSFNRPYGSGPGAWAGVGAGELLTMAHTTRAGGWEYPMIRWLERNGYDVAYATNVDVASDPDVFTGRRAFLIVGHDEYWSRAMRTNVEAARDRGIHLGIFAANVSYWQIRLEPSPYGGANRVMFCTKDAEQDSVYDTEADADLTVRFRDLHPRRPENALVGMMISGEDVQTDFVPVPAQRSHWVFAGTGIAQGTTTRLPGLGGYEVDRSYGDDSLYAKWSPPGLTVLARVPIVSSNGKKTVTETTIYTAKSGAIVFATGTMQWSWGLDDWGAPALHPACRHADAERITKNVLEAFSRGGG